jgi:5'-nucleotidase
MLYTVQPFSDSVYIGTMTGAALEDLLEQQFHADGSRTVLQVSKGFTYSYRENAPQGAHVVPGTIRLDGAPIGPASAVRVAASDFLFYGGDGFSVFENESRIDRFASGDLDALVNFFEKHSPVGPGPRNRITRLP